MGTASDSETVVRPGRVVAAGAFMVVVVVGAMVFRMLTAPPVYHVTVAPGSTALLDVELPRPGGGAANDAVRCEVRTPHSDLGGIIVGVRGTASSDRTIAAKLRVVASPGAVVGRRERRLDFSIEGRAVATQPRIVIEVEPASVVAPPE